jgi:asparagine synthetase B (glutamine-hydrolysing)
MGFAQPEKISANTSLIFELNSLKLQDRRTVYEFDAAHQEKTDFNDWCLAFEESIYKRAVRNVRELLFIGLSSGYDSGAIACALLNQSVPFKAYTLLGRENREVLNQRCQCLVPKAQVEILDDSLPRRNMAHDFILKHVEPFQYRIHSLSGDYNEYHLDLRDDHGAVSLSLLAHHAKQDGRRIYLSGQGADEIFADYGYNGHKIYPHSNFGGLFPQDLTTIFPWPSFYESSMLSYLAKEEYIAGAYGLEARYPYLDPKVIQEFLWLRVDLKNMRYKSVLDHYLTAKGFPFGRNQKFGF